MLHAGVNQISRKYGSNASASTLGGSTHGLKLCPPESQSSLSSFSGMRSDVERKTDRTLLPNQVKMPCALGGTAGINNWSYIASFCAWPDRKSVV